MKMISLRTLAILAGLIFGAAISSPAQSLFVDITDSSGLNVSASHGISFGDYDNDGFLDVYICHSFGRSYLFKNDGNGKFIDKTTSAGVLISERTSSSTWVDYDNDGDLDLFVACFENPNKLYNNNNGSFVNMAGQAGVESDQKISYQGVWADHDRDGYVDLYVANFNVGEANNLFRNNGNGTFSDVTDQAYVSGLPSQKSRSAAWGDFDNDSDLDLFLSSYQPRLIHLFENRLNTYLPLNNWLKVDLTGTESNRSAIGAKVRIVIGDSVQFREKSCGESYISQSSPIMHFGLAETTIVDSMIVNWPSGSVQVLTNVASNQLLTVTENSFLNDSIYCSIGPVKTFADDTVLVAVSIIPANNFSVSSAEITIEGFQNKFDFWGLMLDSSLIGEAAWSIEVNETDSLLIIAAAGANDINEPGLLFSFKLFVPDTTDTGMVPIIIRSVLFDNGEVPVVTIPGSVQVIDQIYGDVDLNEVVRAYDASLILNI